MNQQLLAPEAVPRDPQFAVAVSSRFRPVADRMSELQALSGLPATGETLPVNSQLVA